MVNIGDRVRLHGPTPLLRLQSALGSIARRDERYGDVGFWVVRLDQPATSIDWKGETHLLSEVVEHEDNLTATGRSP